MWLRLVAMATLALAPCASALGQARERLTLDAAFARVDQSHPELRLLSVRRDVLVAGLDRASLRPPVVAGAELENAFGSGDASGLESVELTLTLASVLERGGKFDARRALAQNRIDALAVEREAQRLDLLAEVARRYLAMVAAQEQGDIARLDIRQRQRTVQAARHRLQAGASPESVLLTAQAALARAELDLARSLQRAVAARQHLAALWGERDPQFEIVAADPLSLPRLENFAALSDLLDRTPELARFADERRIREARLQLARSEAAPDLGWQVGVRRFQATDDVALVGSLSMPIGSRRRAEPDIREAEAEVVSLEIEREAKGLSLYSTLAETHGRYLSAQLEVQRLEADVIPKLSRAEAAAERAYRAGAISYLEWAQLQSEGTAARKQQLDAALDAQRALIEIQRLTGEPFVTDPVQREQGETP
ncbi:cobalt-zinc-cadmium efflux system outer membrane protein [Lysobacter niastensis]|uniref:Cobalt-zinc-cadmium efflux system outer membrane protein n=1 Tax=Lysobacter niastensis TaxID=380629 RepID=A0ABU1W971_9GAMM|nr:TolC family protein [Lysobacter niastensis]MDR7134135.1 cobalt-zinc-cadmium efflux system outer membrane protein [Lysobacter niastensis]